MGWITENIINLLYLAVGGFVYGTAVGWKLAGRGVPQEGRREILRSFVLFG